MIICIICASGLLIYVDNIVLIVNNTLYGSSAPQFIMRAKKTHMKTAE